MGALRGGVVGLIASHSPDLSQISRLSRGPCEGCASVGPVSPEAGHLAPGPWEAQQSANGITARFLSLFLYSRPALSGCPAELAGVSSLARFRAPSCAEPGAQLRVDAASDGIGDGVEVHPGARLNDGADHAHEEAWFALVRGGQGGGNGMSDKRHGWSPMLKVRTTQDVSCSLRAAAIMLRCNKDKAQAGERNRDRRTPAMPLSHGTFIVLTHWL